MKRLNFDFSSLTIEKDVPVPGVKTTKQSGCTAVLLKMKKGDSFVMPKSASSDTARYLSAMACSVVKRHKPNRKYTVRTEKTGVRIWRVK